MGGWPKYDTCLGRAFHSQVAPRLVEAINKVCKKFNDAKLSDMGLQCRAITYIHMNDRYESRLLVLVEKKSEYKLGDVGESLEHLRWLEEMQGTSSLLGMEYEAKSLLAWSPPEDWMTRLTPPYNESTRIMFREKVRLCCSRFMIHEFGSMFGCPPTVEGRISSSESPLLSHDSSFWEKR